MGCCGALARAMCSASAHTIILGLGGVILLSPERLRKSRRVWILRRGFVFRLATVRKAQD
jgi:hypothetical protein